MAKRYELSNSEWEKIKHLFAKIRIRTGRSQKFNNITMFDAILWIARSGARWEDMPNRYPPHQSVYSRFCKWRDNGTLEAIFHALSADADLENLSIDSTSVKVHTQSTGAKKGL